jgi:hypothetical protein
VSFAGELQVVAAWIFKLAVLVVGVLVEEEEQKSFTTSFSCKCQEQLSAAPQSSTASLCVLFSLDSKGQIL